MPSTDSPTLAALLTPTGRGAVATIGVRGPGAVNAVHNAFRSASGLDVEAAARGRILFGIFTSIAGGAEELVICRTADEEVEIHCHGGQAAAQAILQTLAASGIRVVSCEQWLAATQDDRIQAEAIAALSLATTERTAGILLDQYRGVLRREVEQLFTEEEPGVSRRLAELCSRSPLGRHLTTPLRIVLAGQPNVGKSSLINALCGYQRAIVSPQPGTTRDVVTASTAFAGWPVQLADTAGLRESHDELESAGIERTHQQLTQADLVLIVVDHSVGWTEAEEAMQQRSPLSLVVYNKCDLPSERKGHCPPGARVSALTGAGLQELEESIGSCLGLLSLHPGDAVPFTERQAKWLERALDAHETTNRQNCLRQLLTNPSPPKF